jgi:hypothetical protein
MIPELPMTMLAAARIGAVHSVVFAGFSAEALASRISAAQSPYVVTAWEGVRGGKAIPLKKIVDEARTKENSDHYIRKVFVFERKYAGGESNEKARMMKDKDINMDTLVAIQRPYCPPVTMDAEDNLFILYTSGSTGKQAWRGACVRFSPYPRLLTLTVARQAQGLGTHNWRVRTLCSVHDQNNVRLNRRGYLCLCRRLWLDYRPYVRRVRPIVEWRYDLCF